MVNQSASTRRTVIVGDTFRIEHLWVVVSHPTADDEVVIANFTTLRGNCDDACVVRPGEHPAIDHDSIVAYRQARLVSRSTLEGAIASGTFRAMTPVSADLLKRIQHGMLASAFARPKLQLIVQQSLAKDDAVGLRPPLT